MRLTVVLLIFGLIMILPAVLFAQDDTEPVEWRNFTFDLENLEGDDMTEDDVFTDGSLYLVDFWASWCRPCSQYLPHLEDMVGEYGDLGFKVVIFCTDEAGTISTALAALRSEEYPFTILFDTEEDVQDELGVRRIPTTILFTASGEEIWRHVGYSSGDEVEVRKQIEASLPGFEAEEPEESEEAEETEEVEETEDTEDTEE